MPNDRLIAILFEVLTDAELQYCIITRHSIEKFYDDNEYIRKFYELFDKFSDSSGYTNSSIKPVDLTLEQFRDELNSSLYNYIDLDDRTIEQDDE